MTFPERQRFLGPYPELHIVDSGGAAYAIASSYAQAITSGGLCYFALLTGTLPFVEFVSAVTGWEFTVTEAIATGKRIQTLRQAFNVREGLRPGDFQLPQRLLTQPPGGSRAESSIDTNDLKRSYYEAMGWDAETGRPSDKNLQELGLVELVGTMS